MVIFKLPLCYDSDGNPTSVGDASYTRWIIFHETGTANDGSSVMEVATCPCCGRQEWTSDEYADRAMTAIKRMAP